MATTFSTDHPAPDQWVILQDLPGKVWSDPTDPTANPAWQPPSTPGWTQHNFGSLAAAAKIAYMLNHAQD